MGFRVEAKDGARTITCFFGGDGKDSQRVPDLDDPDILNEIRAKTYILYLASFRLDTGRLDGDERSFVEFAQDSAQALLDESKKDVTLSSPLRLSSLHETAHKRMREQSKGLQSKREHELLEDAAMDLIEEVERFSCSPQRLLEIALWAEKKQDENLDGLSRLESAAYMRIIVENSNAFFLEEEDQKVKLRQVTLDAANKIGEWSGYPIHQVSEHRLVIPVPTAEKATLSGNFSANGMKTYTICDNSIVCIDTKAHYVHNAFHDGGARILDNGGIAVENRGLLPPEALDGYIYTPIPHERSSSDMSIEAGLMKSPVTLEYISAHWSDPERIFQDLAQNHMDAGGFEERYLVELHGERRWVDRKNLSDGEIVGYELSDRGLGYSPTGIGNMGHTRKRNPFLTGKNGEGLKLAAASAKKNGFDISFASFGADEEKRELMWRADAQTLNEPYTHNGKTDHAHRLAFQITTYPKETLEDRSAITQLELPNGADDTSRRLWKEWVECIDPRNKDARGKRGLERILFIPENATDSFDTRGPVTVLHNRPGAIFENGMLVRTGPQDDRIYTLGWNFPSITSTRERTHINEDMAKAYIRYYFAHTTDESVVEHLLSSIQVHHISKHSIRFSDEDFSRVLSVANKEYQKQDIDPSWALPRGSHYPSLKLFQKVAKRLYPDKILFSYEHAKRDRIPMDGSVRHIREEDRLNVSADDYHALQSVFPTMETFLDNVRTSKIDIHPNELKPLRKVMNGEIDRVSAAIKRIREDDRTKGLLDYILKKSATTLPELYARLYKLRPDATKGKPNDLFIMADDSSADGLASAGIGLRVTLLNAYSRTEMGRLLGVLDHELSHKMLDANDYTDEFMLLLFLLARDAFKNGAGVDWWNR